MCIIDCLSTIVFILPLYLDDTKVIILILWRRTFQLEYWRTFQLVSTRKAERGDFVVNRQAVTLHTRKTCQVPLRHNSYQTARKRMCEYREEKISCKRLMVYKKGVAAKRKICRGIFFSFGCTMGPECFTKFGKRFSLVH